MPTLFDHAGGTEAIHRLEQVFYDSVLSTRSCSHCSARDDENMSII